MKNIKYISLFLLMGVLSGCATTKKMLALCDEIGDNRKQEVGLIVSAKQECSLHAALIEKNVSFCDTWEDSRCYEGLAILKNDISICDKVRDKDRKTCYQRATRSMKVVSKISDRDFRACIANECDNIYDYQADNIPKYAPDYAKLGTIGVLYKEGFLIYKNGECVYSTRELPAPINPSIPPTPTLGPGATMSGN